MPIMETIAVNGFSGMLANLASNYLERKVRSINVTEIDLKTNLNNHMEVVFQKCTKIKTIISDKPTDFLSIYVNQNFESGESKVDQFDLIDNIRGGESFVITGTGGGGKSMFMRYLWLSYFEKSDGKIPFFLELRQLNNVTHSKLEDFIFHSIIQTRSTISQKSFEKAISNGEFILFFDGFDEINIDIRDKVEQWIIGIKENNPRLTVVLSSRPMERFHGWAGFSTVGVSPLEKQQVIELIDKAPFFDEDKRKFKKKISDGLYDTHSGFLSNPLLAYMMLVTISYNPDIPVTMHLFYEMAFEALYYRHDLTKNGYKRQFKSNLDKQVFVKILSYFSLISYHAQAYEFNIGQFYEFCDKVRRAESIEFNSDDFLEDLIDCLCIIKKEGLDYSFTHRSFQEYFSAYCMSRVTSKNLDRIFNSFADRYSDQVLSMVYEMNVFLFREKYLLPIYERYREFFDDESDEECVLSFFEYSKSSFQFVIHIEKKRAKTKNRPQRGYSIFLDANGDFYALHIISHKLEKIKLLRESAASIEPSRDVELLSQSDQLFADKYFPSASVGMTEISIKIADGKLYVVGKDGVISTDNEGIFEDFKGTGMYYWLKDSSMRLRKFMKVEIMAYSKLSNTFDDLF